MKTSNQKSSTETTAQTLRYGLKIVFHSPPYSYKNDANSCIITGDADLMKLSTQYTSEILADHTASNPTELFLDANEEKDYHISLEYTASSCVTLGIHVSQNSRIFIHTTGDATFVSEQIRVHAAKNISVQIYCIQQLSTSQTTYIASKNATVQPGSNVSWFDVQVGAEYAQSEVTSNLLFNATSSIAQVYVSQQKQQHNLYTAMNHIGECSKSSILARGVVTHHAKALSRGLIHIGQDAFGSEGYEKQEALLLSNTAEADAIPNLEIHNHDVKCSHGSTIGKLNEEQLLYLQMRGLDLEQAQRLLIHAYFAPIVDKLEGSVQKSIIAAIESLTNYL